MNTEQIDDLMERILLARRCLEQIPDRVTIENAGFVIETVDWAYSYLADVTMPEQIGRASCRERV